MKRSVYLIVGQTVSACLLSLYGCSNNSAHTLNASEVKTLFSGKTASAYHQIQKAPVSLYYAADGEVRGIFASGKKGATQWWVKDDGNICLKVKGKDACFAVVENNGQYSKHLIKAGGKRVPVFALETFSDGNIHQY